MHDKKRVLIIDDEELHLYTSKALLESEELEVVTYQGAFGATNNVKTVKPDLVLLDVNMPALSGENLVTLIKPWCMERRIPILFYSSNDEGILRAMATDYGVHGYICKGDIAGLYKKVEDALRQLATTGDEIN